ncbi:hypothetical protein [Streptococcus suis]
MAESDVIWEKVRQKEYALMDFEDEVIRQKRAFETTQNEVHDRWLALHRLVSEESDKMHDILSRYNASYDDAKEFFQLGEEMLAEADYAHRRRQDQLLLEEEEFDRMTYRRRDDLEEELYQLRRAYAEADE